MSSAIAMDKTLAKELFCLHGIPTPKSISVPRGESGVLPEGMNFPLIIKANNGGSSIGVKLANDDVEYGLAMAEAYRYDDIALVEQYIEGREFSVAILAGKALPVVEIAPRQGFFDYHNKYQPDATVETCPAVITADLAAALQRLAEKVFVILRLSNYARVDFMMDSAGKLYCLEANTLPGMSPNSLLPKEAVAAGMSFGELCEKIVGYSLGGSA
jgi:D-alanine-D-alanine ligase